MPCAGGAKPFPTGLAQPANTVEARKLKLDGPPTPSQIKMGNWHTLSYVNVENFLESTVVGPPCLSTPKGEPASVENATRLLLVWLLLSRRAAAGLETYHWKMQRFKMSSWPRHIYLCVYAIYA